MHRGLEARRLEGVDGAQSSDNSGLMGLGPARGLDGIGLGVERFQEEASTSPRCLFFPRDCLPMQWTPGHGVERCGLRKPPQRLNASLLCFIVHLLIYGLHQYEVPC